MKRPIFIIIWVVCVVLISGMQTVSQETAVEEKVGSGCIGECKAPTKVEYTVNSKCNVLVIARTVETSLCPDMGVHIFLFKNGEEVGNGHITRKDDAIQTEAEPGDKIMAYIMTYPLYNGINCIRQGNLKFELFKKNIEKRD
ncbi:MAG TPA: hypothetical protein VK186_27270 [Candidatus Deferrimicrobium sp.]|nr:hypothetical protein [Candidatus Deferrimicrobium sp.]